MKAPSLWSRIPRRRRIVGLTIAWLSGYAIVLARFRRVLGRARVRRTIDAVSGALLATFGVRLAIADR